ncbi:hypothetical protein D9M72_330440 [compost metagenome]
MVPVTDFDQPMMLGPKKPPDRPIVLIRAMAPARALPLMYAGGTAQKTMLAIHIRPVATVTHTSVTARLPSARYQPMKQRLLMAAGTAMWIRRS